MDIEKIANKVAKSLLDAPNMRNGVKYLQKDFDDLIADFKSLQEAIVDYEKNETLGIDAKERAYAVKNDIKGMVQTLQIFDKSIDSYILPNFEE